MATPPDLRAATYDLIIKGGRVIDPSLRLDAVRDVAIPGGRIAAVEAAIAGDAPKPSTRAASSSCPASSTSTPTPAAERRPGAVPGRRRHGFIDAGSQGADRIAESIAVANTAPQPCRVLINIGRAGILPEGDTMDLARADVGRRAPPSPSQPRHHRRRESAAVARRSPAPTTRGAAARAGVASAFELPVMIHMGQTFAAAELLELLKPGDIVTHMFAPPPNSIVDDAGRILPEVLAARRRGIWFDVGNGRTGHMRWDIVEKVMQAGFWPDTFSTDWTQEGARPQVFDFPNCCRSSSSSACRWIR